MILPIQNPLAYLTSGPKHGIFFSLVHAICDINSRVELFFCFLLLLRSSFLTDTNFFLPISILVLHPIIQLMEYTHLNPRIMEGNKNLNTGATQLKLLEGGTPREVVGIILAFTVFTILSIIFDLSFTAKPQTLHWNEGIY